MNSSRRSAGILGAPPMPRLPPGQRPAGPAESGGCRATSIEASSSCRPPPCPAAARAAAEDYTAALRGGNSAASALCTFARTSGVTCRQAPQSHPPVHPKVNCAARPRRDTGKPLCVSKRASRLGSVNGCRLRLLLRANKIESLFASTYKNLY